MFAQGLTVLGENRGFRNDLDQLPAQIGSKRVANPVPYDPDLPGSKQTFRKALKIVG